MKVTLKVIMKEMKAMWTQEAATLNVRNPTHTWDVILELMWLDNIQFG